MEGAHAILTSPHDMRGNDPVMIGSIFFGSMDP